MLERPWQRVPRLSVEEQGGRSKEEGARSERKKKKMKMEEMISGIAIFKLADDSNP